MAIRKEIITAYRHLYRQCLHAVQYSKPARYTARDRLRQAFRNNDASAFDSARIQTTIEFLNGAARSKGLEHKIVKNLLHVWATRARQTPIVRLSDPNIQAHAYDGFDHAIEMLNKTMGTCIE